MVVSSSAFHILLFVVLFLMIGWPLVTITSENRDVSIFLYLYGLWAVVIVGLLLMTKAFSDNTPTDSSSVMDQSDPDDERHV